MDTGRGDGARGGGLFFLEVYSVSGIGAWAAEWSDTD
jgi:hypothetical protein